MSIESSTYTFISFADHWRKKHCCRDKEAGNKTCYRFRAATLDQLILPTSPAISTYVIPTIICQYIPTHLYSSFIFPVISLWKSSTMLLKCLIIKSHNGIFETTPFNIPMNSTFSSQYSIIVYSPQILSSFCKY